MSKGVLITEQSAQELARLIQKERAGAARLSDGYPGIGKDFIIAHGLNIPAVGGWSETLPVFSVVEVSLGQEVSLRGSGTPAKIQDAVPVWTISAPSLDGDIKSKVYGVTLREARQGATVPVRIAGIVKVRVDNTVPSSLLRYATPIHGDTDKMHLAEYGLFPVLGVSISGDGDEDKNWCVMKLDLGAGNTDTAILKVTEYEAGTGYYRAVRMIYDNDTDNWIEETHKLSSETVHLAFQNILASTDSAWPSAGIISDCLWVGKYEHTDAVKHPDGSIEVDTYYRCYMGGCWKIELTPAPDDVCDTPCDGEMA